MFKQEGDFEKLCLKLNYQFCNKELLARAITTKSAWHNNLQQAAIGHHEEMAFFGDGILRMVVDKILMEEFPYYNTGELSRVRDLLVKNANLSEAAKRLGLEPFILMDHNQDVLCHQGSPKLLADTIEAIIYAIYKDSGENLQEVKSFILSHSSISNTLKEYREQEEKRNMPIIHAIQHGNLEFVEKLLQSGFSPNFIFSYLESDIVQTMYCYEEVFHEKFLTPLDYALDCLEKRAALKENPKTMLSIIECLLRFGANPNLQAKNNRALIKQLFSPRTYDGQIADHFFIKYKRDYTTRQNFKDSISDIDKALEDNLISNWEEITDQVVEMLCRFGVKLDEEDFSDYETSLGLAIIHQQHRKIDLLLQYKINPNIPNNLGETPLYLACSFADADLIAKLLKAGADPNIANKEGLRPFDIAPLPALKILLLEEEIRQKTLNKAETIDIETIKSTAMSYYNKWLTDKLMAALAHAIRLFSQVLKHKLQRVSFNDKSLVADFYNLGTAYFQRQSYEKAKPLLERAYFLYQINEQQFQPKTDKYLNRLTECKQYAEKNKAQERISATIPTAINNLSTRKKSVSQPEPQAITPNREAFNTIEFDEKLFSAIQSHHANEVKNLLEKGANPDAISNTNTPILHYAIQMYHQAVMMSDVTSDMPYNEFSVGSFKYGALKIIELLLAFGSDPNLRDEKGRTALHMAAILDKSNVVTLLLEKGADLNLRDHGNNFASYYAKDSYTRHLILTALVATAQPAKEETKFTHSSKPSTENEEKSSKSKVTALQKDSTIKIENKGSNTNIGGPTSTLRNSNNKIQNNNVVKNTSIKPQALINPKKKQNKKILCKFFKEGKPNSCNKGSDCKFAHSTTELKK